MATPASDLRGSDSRGNMDIFSDRDLNHERYVQETLTPDETEYIATEPQTRTYETPALDVQAIQRGIDQAEWYANRVAEREANERRVQLVRYLGDLGVHLQANRDYVKADFDEAA